MRMTMDSWRSIDRRAAFADAPNIKVRHNRCPMLEQFANTANTWQLILHNMTAISETEELDKLRADVEDFAAWVDASLLDLDEKEPPLRQAMFAR